MGRNEDASASAEPAGQRPWTATVLTRFPDMFPGPLAHSLAATALDFAAAILGSGRGSWLTREVRTPGFASSARAFHHATSEVGVFEVSLEGDASTIDEAVHRAIALVAELAAAGPSAEDLSRARARATVRGSRRQSG